MTEHTETHPGPEAMRAAVAGYVQEIHRAYVDQAATFSPGVQGRMPLMTAGRITVAAVAARNLHLLATDRGARSATWPGGRPRGRLRRHRLGAALLRPGGAARPRSPRGARGSGVRGGQARPRCRDGALPRGRAAGRRTVGHQATHVGTGLANGHSSASRDFETIRSRARGREALVDELAGAAVAGLPHAQALLARAISPYDEGVRETCEAAVPDPEAIRKAVLTAVGGRTQWMPAGSTT